MFDRRAVIDAIIVVGVIIFASPAYAQEKSIVVASTTSARDSGLFEYLLPIFKQKTGITVKVLAEGSGRSLDTARRGDADVGAASVSRYGVRFLVRRQKDFPG
jgi:ABC-type tungstate transport system permease subunit